MGCPVFKTEGGIMVNYVGDTCINCEYYAACKYWNKIITKLRKKIKEEEG